jgi:hypothetical protein
VTEQDAGVAGAATRRATARAVTPWRECAWVAVIAAGISALIAWMSMDGSGLAKDFSLPWTAARHLLAGRDPYAAMQPTGIYPFNVPFYYPLPAAILSVPFALFPATVAGVLFVAMSFATAAAALARQGRHRAIVLLGFPAVMAATLGQWSPLLMAATLVPALQFVMPVKPTLGAAVFASRPSWTGVVGSAAILAISFAVMPGWVPAWRHAVSTAWSSYTPPIQWAGWAGLGLLVSLIWWRDRDARLLAVLAIAPQLPLFYDQLLVHAVARTRREAWILVVASWVGGLVWSFRNDPLAPGEYPARGLILATIYAPATILVALRQWKGRAHDASLSVPSP